MQKERKLLALTLAKLAEAPKPAGRGSAGSSADKIVGSGASSNWHLHRRRRVSMEHVHLQRVSSGSESEDGSSHSGGIAAAPPVVAVERAQQAAFNPQRKSFGDLGRSSRGIGSGSASNIAAFRAVKQPGVLSPVGSAGGPPSLLSLLRNRSMATGVSATRAPIRRRGTFYEVAAGGGGGDVDVDVGMGAVAVSQATTMASEAVAAQMDLIRSLLVPSLGEGSVRTSCATSGAHTCVGPSAGLSSVSGEDRAAAATAGSAPLSKIAFDR
jgi:hypothetical protein